MAGRLTHGDVIVVSPPGEYGKPRPAVIVQSEITEVLTSVIVCPLSTSLVDSGPLRPLIEPARENELRETSQVMVDKITAVHLRRTGGRIGRITTADMRVIDASLAAVLGLRSP